MEHVDIAHRVQAWITTELPKRPTGEAPKRAQPRERQRRERSNQEEEMKGTCVHKVQQSKESIHGSMVKI